MRTVLPSAVLIVTCMGALALAAGEAAKPSQTISAADVIAAWRNANPGLVAGTTPVGEFAVADKLAEPAALESLWGPDVPADVKPAANLTALVRAVGKAGCLMPGEAIAAWTKGLAGCRALIIPDGAVLSDQDAAQVREFVKKGGAAIAFGHASRLGQDGKARADYALADVFGVHSEGLVKFDTESTRGVTASSDSNFGGPYGPENVMDGASEGTKGFWASKDAPMPHWVQISFPSPRTIGRADVTCRPGFLLQDFEVRCQVGNDWVTAAKVVNNEEPVTIRCPFEKPVVATAVRLHITKESLGGKDRQIADVGEITLYDGTGRQLLAPPYRLDVRISDAGWAKANRSAQMALRSPALRLRPDGAKALAAFGDPLGKGGELPFCTRHDFGQGRAYLFAVPEARLGAEPEVWETLLRTFVGLPAVRHSGDEDVVATLWRGDGRYVLHLVDTLANPPASRAKEVIVRLNLQALGPIQSASLLPDGKALDLKRQGDWLQVTAPMSPMASVLLKAKP